MNLSVLLKLFISLSFFDEIQYTWFLEQYLEKELEE